MVDDLPRELVGVGVGHQEVGVSLQVLAVREVGCCLEVVQRSSVLGQLRSLLVAEGEVRAFLVEHWEVEVLKQDWAWVHQGAMVEVDPHVMARPGLVEVYWVRVEGGLLQCPV